MDMRDAIRAVTEGRDLTPEEMSAVMRIIMTGEATEAQIGGFLIGLRMKGETVGEIAAAAEVMRDLSARVEVERNGLVDVVGTGGDVVHTFNISTASALVAAGAGAKVAKHGNPLGFQQVGSGRPPRGERGQSRPFSRGSRAVHRGGGHRVHVRTEAPFGHALRHRSPAGDGGAHRLQSPRSSHQPCRGAQPARGGLRAGVGPSGGGSAATPRQRARARRALRRRTGRDEHRGSHPDS